MSDVVELAEAVKDEINGHSFAAVAAHPELAFTAERKPIAVVARNALATCHVTVCPGDVAEEMLTRGSTDFETQIEIGLQMQLPDLTADSVDPLYDLYDQIADFLRRVRPAGFPTAAWRKTERAKPIPEHLQEMLVFTGVLRLTYQIVR